MKENQKNTKVTIGTPGVKQNKDARIKSDNLSQKPHSVVKGEIEIPEKEIEPKREHKHDYKTPEGKPNPKKVNKGKIQKENTVVVKNNQSSKQVKHKS